MQLITLLRSLLLITECVLALPILYLVVISVAAIAKSLRRSSSDKLPELTSWPRFAILIPAHNEEVILGTLLKSLSLLKYPKDLYMIYVIADNCTDATATLARNSMPGQNLRVYERFDDRKRAKGYALEWMFQNLRDEGAEYTAYVILDADAVVRPDLLHRYAQKLNQGVQALQAQNNVLNMYDSASTALRWISMTLVNHVRPLGRNAIGGSSPLTGCGICLTHEILQKYPWRAYGLAEDYEYYLNLVEHGNRVEYVPDAEVRSVMPTSFEQMRTQDIRWESSQGQRSGFATSMALLKAGLRQRDFMRLEALMEFITPPLSILAGGTLGLLLVSLLLMFSPAIFLGLVMLLGLGMYLGTAFLVLRPPLATYRALLSAPGFMLWKLWVVLVVNRSKKQQNWVRTSRGV